MKTSYPFTIWSGLVERKHRERMGTAIWEFLWLVDKVTREEDGKGCVLGGKPITCAEIAEDLGECEESVRRAMTRLRNRGYIEIMRRPGGMVIAVLRSKKWEKRVNRNVDSRAVRPDKSVGSDPTLLPEGVDRNVVSDPTKMSVRPNKNVGSPRSHDMYKDITEDKYKDIKAGSAFLFEEIDSLPREEYDELAQAAIEEMTAQPFTRSLFVETQGGLILGTSQSAKVLHKLAMLKILRNGRAIYALRCFGSEKQAEAQNYHSLDSPAIRPFRR